MFRTALLCFTLLAAGTWAQKLTANDLCRPSDPKQGGCKIDGSGCAGEQVTFAPYNLTISKWDDTTKNYTLLGKIESHAIVGKQDTWQMYLHGPRLRPSEKKTEHEVPPLYVQATFNNRIYKFENITKGAPDLPLKATQKMVGNAIAPSTSYPIEDSETGLVKGLLVACGNPFWANSPLHPVHFSMFKGGVDYLNTENCSRVFPLSPPATPKVAKQGQVVNTVDCHPKLGVCFFTVWKFYDDTPMFKNDTGPDCLWYCVMKTGGLDGRPVCDKMAVVQDENGAPICSKHGVGAVHGMTVGNTLSIQDSGNGEFDALLVFTGGMKFDEGESSMKKIHCKVSTTPGGVKDMQVIKSTAFATQLFQDTVTPGHDVGGDHAWVDDTKKHVWISTFRLGNPGVHMVDYETGKLLYSIHGIDSYLEDNYSYSAGIHGTGSLGVPGSALAVATSACTMPHKACFPMPWGPMTPKKMEAKGIFFVLDLQKIITDATAKASSSGEWKGW